jgi:transposase
MVKCTKRQIRQLKKALHWKMPEAQRQRTQMILLRESGMAQPAIADAMGVSLSTVYRAHMAYDRGGIKALKPKPSGGRKRENMTLAEEKTLLMHFAKAAGAGEMLNIHDLKAAYEKAIGHVTSNSKVYNLLAAPSRSATRLGKRQHPLPDGQIGGAKISWRSPLNAGDAAHAGVHPANNHSALIPASLMIGHHFSISTF